MIIMPEIITEIKFTKNEKRLIDLAQRGLIRTIASSQYIKSSLNMTAIRPEAIDAAIEAAYTKASQEALTEEEVNKQWEIVVMLCNIPWKRHQPTQTMVDKALEQATLAAQKTNNWNFVFALLNLSSSACKPSQVAVDKILDSTLTAAAQMNCREIVLKLLNLSDSKNKLSQNTVDKVFAAAVQTQNWDIVFDLLNPLKPLRKPSQSAIDAAIKASYKAAWRAVQQEDTSDEELDSLWQNIVKLCSSHKELPGPSFDVFDKTLDQATLFARRTGNWRFVFDLLNLPDSARKPSQFSINEVLDAATDVALRTNDWNNVFKLLNLPSSASKPNQQAVDRVLFIAIEAASRTQNWKPVIDLACLTAPSQQPSIEAVTKALNFAAVLAAKNHNWYPVIALASLEAPASQVNQSTMNNLLDLVLRKANRYELMGEKEIASRAWETVSFIVSLKPPATTAEQKMVNYAFEELDKVNRMRVNERLINLANCGAWDEVLAHFKLDACIIPPLRIMGEVFRHAVCQNRWDVIGEICGVVQPDRRTAADLLNIAAREGNIDGVKLIFKLDAQNKPTLSFIDNAISIAKFEKNMELVSYLTCEKIRQTQSAKDPLELAKTILQNFLDNSLAGSSLFSAQVRGVKTILTHFKRDLAQGEGEKALMEALRDLKNIMGTNKVLSGYYKYIEAHCCNQGEQHNPRAEFNI